MRLTLQGPKNYLLVEDCRRAAHGTTIRVHLRDRLEELELTNYVRDLCVRVEFPVEITNTIVN